MRYTLQYIALAVVILLAFYGFSREVKRGRMRNLDFAVTIKVQDKMQKWTGGRFDGVFEDAGFFSGPVFSTITVIGLTGFAFVRAKGWKKKLGVLVIPAAFFLLIFAEIYGKSVVHHPAPPFFLLKNPTTIFPKYYINEQYSYPSGHAARAVFVAIIAACVMHHASDKKKYRNKGVFICCILIAYVGLVSFTRIYLGHHWFSDIFGGLIAGTAFALMVLPVLGEF